ncbi:MAG: endonuclease III [Chloroflexi bacterium]|nr:MAG: endonuclease III [Chloroflexota bacterium]
MNAFEIDHAMKVVEKAVRPFPKAAMFELHEEGFTTPFEQLIGCILSIRTRDEVVLPTARRLYAQARTPAAMQALGIQGIDNLIKTVSFHERKAAQIHAIATQLVNDFSGELPCDRDLILSFKGVGPKCANLALGIACGEQFISVDIHVHRIANRWGYIATTTPEKSMNALTTTLPNRYWIEINRLLVPFGKHICTGPRPKCSTCPLNTQCPRIGVTSFR